MNIRHGILLAASVLATHSFAMTASTQEQTLYRQDQQKLELLKHDAEQKPWYTVNSSANQLLQNASSQGSNQANNLVAWLNRNPLNAYTSLGGQADIFYFNRQIGGGSSSNSGIDIHKLGLSLLAHYQAASVFMQVGGGPRFDKLLDDLSGTYGGNKIPSFDLRQAYLVYQFGQSPLYAIAGEKNIDYGQFENPTQYSNPLTRQFFMARGNEAGLGFQHNGIQLNASFVEYDGGINLPYTVDSASKSAFKNTLNYALNAAYTLSFSKLDKLKVETGYLAHGAFVEDYNPTNFIDFIEPTKYSGVYTGGMKLTLNRFSVGGEYVRTVAKAIMEGKSFSVKDPQRTPKHLSAYDIYADYKLPFANTSIFSRTKLVGSYSEFHYAKDSFAPDSEIFQDLGSTMTRLSVEVNKQLNSHWGMSMAFINNNASWDAKSPERFNNQKIFILGTNLLF